VRALLAFASVLTIACCGGRTAHEVPATTNGDGGSFGAPSRAGAGGGAGVGGGSSPAGGGPVGPGGSDQAPIAPNTDVFVPNDVGVPPRASDDPPTTCDDAGTYVGISSCCSEKLCNGHCDIGGGCWCGSSTGFGCPWPLVCCGGACAGPDSPGCRSPGAAGSDEDTRTVVQEGDGCGIHSTAIYPYPRMCCNGQICEGRCLLDEVTGAHFCDCAHLLGGCPAPLICCGSQGAWCDDKKSCIGPTDSKEP
jgi:hypothetical protein